jgi:hypothetical protein
MFVRSVIEVLWRYKTRRAIKTYMLRLPLCVKKKCKFTFLKWMMFHRTSKRIDH